MAEDIIFKRRNRLKKHFVPTSHVLLYCYSTVSDAAKITYQVIDSFDWESKETGDSKGYVFPATEKLATIRKMSERTIQRHIKELEHAGLLTRQRRRYKPSILYIEDVADEEIATYFATFVDAPAATHTKQAHNEPAPSRNDKNVVSATPPETTNVSFVYMKENEEKKENEISVNGNNAPVRGGVSSVAAIMKRFDRVGKAAPQNAARRKRDDDQKIRRDYYATQLADALHDQKSLGCYRVIAEKVPQTVLFEALGAAKEAWQDGKVKKSRAALFMSIIKTYCEKHRIELGFAP